MLQAYPPKPKVCPELKLHHALGNHPFAGSSLLYLLLQLRVIPSLVLCFYQSSLSSFLKELMFEVVVFHRD